MKWCARQAWKVSDEITNKSIAVLKNCINHDIVKEKDERWDFFAIFFRRNHEVSSR